MATKSFQIEEIDSIGHCSLSTIQRITADSKISSESKLSSEPAEVSEKNPNEVVLKRHLGLFSGTCFIVGIIIGLFSFYKPVRILYFEVTMNFLFRLWNFRFAEKCSTTYRIYWSVSRCLGWLWLSFSTWSVSSSVLNHEQWFILK